MTSAAAGIPRGRYIASLHMFQIIHNKGKTFSNGGVGIALPKEVHAKQHHAGVSQYGEDDTDESPYNLYLWVEEALYLHDAGLADFIREHDSKQDQKGDEQALLLTTQELFEIMLSTSDGRRLNMSLPVYRVYAHLRLQSFRVLRYVPPLTLENSAIASQEDIVSTTDNKETVFTATNTLAYHLSRRRMSQAPPPQVWRQGNENQILAWQVYDPNANFRKTNPGRPSFYVTVCLYSEPSPNVMEFYNLLKDDDIPIKVAAVADSGTVILFGLTNFGVPSIAAPSRAAEDEEKGVQS